MWRSPEAIPTTVSTNTNNVPRCMLQIHCSATDFSLGARSMQSKRSDKAPPLSYIVQAHATLGARIQGGQQ